MGLSQALLSALASVPHLPCKPPRFQFARLAITAQLDPPEATSRMTQTVAMRQ
jgi:hypothetical protein